jgi:hypothetical protein
MTSNSLAPGFSVEWQFSQREQLVFRYWSNSTPLSYFGASPSSFAFENVSFVPAIKGMPHTRNRSSQLTHLVSSSESGRFTTGQRIRWGCSESVCRPSAHAWLYLGSPWIFRELQRFLWLQAQKMRWFDFRLNSTVEIWGSPENSDVSASKANGLCFDKIVSLYFGAPKTTTIDIGVKRKRDFLDLLKNLPKNY